MNSDTSLTDEDPATLRAQVEGHAMVLAMAGADHDQMSAALEAAERQLKGYQHHLRACEQIAGKALGYPWFKDDQKNFPGTTEEDGVCIGDHVGDTIVEELATALQASEVRARTAEEAISKGVLWAVHVRGPDDIHPAESYEMAIQTCDLLLAMDRENAADALMPMLSAVPMIWLGTANEHAAGLATIRGLARQFPARALSPTRTEGGQ